MFAQDENTRWIVHYQVPHGVDWRTVDLNATVRKMIGADTEFEIISSGPWTGGVALIAERYQTKRILSGRRCGASVHAARGARHEHRHW